MKISEILDKKGRDIYSIEENRSILDFVMNLTEKRIGCLLVRNSDNEITGIATERDLVKAYSKYKNQITSMNVKEIMTPLSQIITIKEDEDVQNAMSIMTSKKIRHLPTINDKNKVSGMLSIGDLVNALLTVKDTQIMMLQDYINGKYPG
ncbi:MAG: CBS domain-containing protein [Spirochaetales bacterium]|jgi:CBS domain-containing protein|nr:CBS domain-containing protein [Exilispira sp.]NMC67364.1 CBS domain-containing protein [Spirochaetales bacterium]